MSEEKQNDDGQQAGGEKQDEFKPITSQEEFERALGKRLERERAKFADYDDLRAKAEKFDEVEQANKSELERIQERAEAAERKAAELELSTLKAEVASEKGLTLKQAKRLVGKSREELEADADEILADFGPATTKKSPPEAKTLKSGSSGSGGNEQGRAAAAIRQMRGAH